MKLTEQQAEALFGLMESKLKEVPENMAESLLKDINFKIFQKLRSKLEAFPKKSYNLSLSAIESKAFYLYWYDEIFTAHEVYERTLMGAKLAEIDKQYA